jgi:hypothetical protein
LDVSANHHIERKKPMPYVNHYSFHILDPDWGHITIKINGHPPFPAQVILNGHEYVTCQARKAGISFTKEGNCFTHISDAAGLAKIADTLSGQRTIGRLSQACERWIYTTCLCFAIELEEQQQSGFHYQYSNYQVEYSRNLIFEIGGHISEMLRLLEHAVNFYLAGNVQQATFLAQTILQNASDPKRAYSAALMQCFWRAWKNACPGVKL